MSGFIQVHRKMRKSVVFQDPYYLKLWVWLMFRARYQEGDVLVGNQVVHLEVGQLIWGRDEAAQELNQGLKGKDKRSPSSWEKYLKNLEKLNKITRKPNNKFTVVTLDKYAFYQDVSNDFTQQANSKLTASSQQANTKNKDNKDNKENKTPNYTKEQLRLSEKLRDNLSADFPNAMKKVNIENWVNQIRLLEEKDNETIESIEYVINWLPTNDFWSGNIRSTKKLREQFERLKKEIRNERQPKRFANEPNIVKPDQVVVPKEHRV